MIQGLSHITLVVRDLARMSAVVEHIFGGVQAYDSGEHGFSLAREKFYLIGGLWLCIMEGEPLGGRDYSHIAFRIDEAEFDAYLERVHAMKLRIRPGRDRIPGEGRSIYFYDDDGHLFELHASALEQRLAAYRDAANSKTR